MGRCERVCVADLAESLVVVVVVVVAFVALCYRSMNRRRVCVGVRRAQSDLRHDYSAVCQTPEGRRPILASQSSLVRSELTRLESLARTLAACNLVGLGAGGGQARTRRRGAPVRDAMEQATA